MVAEVISNSEAETLTWAKAFSKQLKPGDILSLIGTLGTGKTVICRGLAQGLGFHGDVHSPTYALVHEYPGTTPIFHMDLYRLSTNADWEEIGLDHYFHQGGICLIEWAERLPESIRFTYTINIERISEDSRRIQVSTVYK